VGGGVDRRRPGVVVAEKLLDDREWNAVGTDICAPREASEGSVDELLSERAAVGAYGEPALRRAGASQLEASSRDKSIAVRVCRRDRHVPGLPPFAPTSRCQLDVSPAPERCVRPGRDAPEVGTSEALLQRDGHQVKPPTEGQWRCRTVVLASGARIIRTFRTSPRPSRNETPGVRPPTTATANSSPTAGSSSRVPPPAACSRPTRSAQRAAKRELDPAWAGVTRPARGRTRRRRGCRRRRSPRQHRSARCHGVRRDRSGVAVCRRSDLSHGACRHDEYADLALVPSYSALC
jgi:hypothetical protein